MVLVDTSVWIRFLYGNQAYRRELDGLLNANEVLGHDLVYGELLIGDRGGRTQTLVAYERMQQAKMVPHDIVVQLVEARGLHGRGVGWIDVHLLASAMVERAKLWTADPRFAAVVEELGMAHKV